MNNQNIKALTIDPNKGANFQFYDNNTMAPAQPAQPAQPTVGVGDASGLFKALSGLFGQDKAISGLSPVYGAGEKLGSPQLLNALSSIAAMVSPADTWAGRLGASVQQRTSNQLYQTMLQKLLSGGQSPFPQASQQ